MRGGGGISKENDMLCLLTEHTHKKKDSCQNSCTHNDTTVCKVIRWNICKSFDIPVPENLWEYGPKADTENVDVPLTYDLMIPSSVNIENKAL